MAQDNWRSPELTPEEKTAQLILTRFEEKPPVNVRRRVAGVVSTPIGDGTMTVPRSPGTRPTAHGHPPVCPAIAIWTRQEENIN